MCWTDKGDARIFSTIIVKVAECLQYFEALLDDADKQHEKVLVICQMATRSILPPNMYILSPYDECPCSSGSKIKFCCGTRKN